MTTLVLTMLMAMAAFDAVSSAQAATGGILEKALNLDVALRLGRMLEASGYTVFYTRTDDSNPSRRRLRAQ